MRVPAPQRPPRTGRKTVERRLTLSDLARMQAAGERIAMLTCYEASFARVCDAAGVDMLLIGDSLGMVVQGRDSTLGVTLQDIAYHTACVARGSARGFIVADMPFGSYQENAEQAFRNAAVLMAAGAHMVKVEGGVPMADTVRFLVERGIPVCGHVGLTPQSVHQLGGYRVQGRGSAGDRLLADCAALEAAGAAMVVLEAIPASLADRVTAATKMATIGIGASAKCSGQVLVLQDMLDIPAGRKAKFVRNFMQGASGIEDAIRRYVAAVKDGSFPGPEHCYPD
jgi:3-methyl-2-oxobutanoate hydroxymethyltransferase